VRDSLLSKPSTLPHSQTDVKRISTAGGIERSTNDIKVSSHYEPCHSIYITWRLNVNFSPPFFLNRYHHHILISNGNCATARYIWKLALYRFYPKLQDVMYMNILLFTKHYFRSSALERDSLKFNILLANHVLSVCRFFQTQKQTQSFFFFFYFFHSFLPLIVKLCST